MSGRFAAHLPPAIRNLPARTRRFTIGAAAAITIGAAVTIPALLVAAAPPGIAVLASHSGPVFSVAFSPDSKILAGGGGVQGVRLWDLATGRQIGDLPTGPTSWVGSVAFSPDGRTLAGGGGYAALRSRVWLWGLATGRAIGHRLTRSDGGIGSVAFSPDGKTLASASVDGTVRLWDVATHRQINGATTATGPPANGTTATGLPGRLPVVMGGWSSPGPVLLLDPSARLPGASRCRVANDPGRLSA